MSLISSNIVLVGEMRQFTLIAHSDMTWQTGTIITFMKQTYHNLIDAEKIALQNKI
jgi:hypothetical protein